MTAGFIELWDKLLKFLALANSLCSVSAGPGQNQINAKTIPSKPGLCKCAAEDTFLSAQHLTAIVNNWNGPITLSIFHLAPYSLQSWCPASPHCEINGWHGRCCWRWRRPADRGTWRASSSQSRSCRSSFRPPSLWRWARCKRPPPSTRCFDIWHSFCFFVFFIHQNSFDATKIMRQWRCESSIKPAVFPVNSSSGALNAWRQINSFHFITFKNNQTQQALSDLYLSA